MYSCLECSWRLLLLLPQRHFGIKVVAPSAARPCVRFPIAVHGRRLRQAAFPCGTSLLPLWPRQHRPRRVKAQKMCQTGYTQTDVTTVSAPIVISSTIAADALTYRLTPLLSAGSHIYHLVISSCSKLFKPERTIDKERLVIYARLGSPSGTAMKPWPRLCLLWKTA